MSQWNEKIIEEVGKGRKILSYRLTDNLLFDSTEYQVMKNSGNDLFVNCIVDKIDGQIKLNYLIEDIEALDSYLLRITKDEMNEIFNLVLRGIEDIKNTGFLEISNIDFSLGHIFINHKNKQISFIYLPLDGVSTLISFNEISNCLKEAFNRINPVDVSYINEKQESTQNEVFKSESIISNRIGLYDITTLNFYEFKQGINVVGKSAQLSDLVIEGNPAISRKHCQINYTEDNAFIIDLNSSNKTYINGTVLNPGVEYKIQMNDRVCIANQEFVVKGM